MKIVSVLVIPLLCGALVACGSSGDSVSSDDPQNIATNADSQSLASDGIQSDDDPGSTATCDADFDHAELLYTETDRQWFCSVSSSSLASSDEVYFNSDGTAQFSRFGQVYWNRNLQNDEINIASPFISSHVMREISSANTTLQFILSDDTEDDQEYDCVLVDRSTLS